MLLSRRRILAATTLTLMTIVAGQAGCVIIGGGSPTIKGSQSASTGHVAGSGLKVETDNGSIDVRATGGGAGSDSVAIQAEVRAQTKERLDLVKVRSEREADGVLRVWVDWPEGKRLENEGASLVISLPDARGVTAKTSNGGVVVTGVGGDAVLTTSNGQIRAIRQGGDIVATTSNGGVAVEESAGAVRAKASNGKISVSMGAGAVTARTSNGSVDVSLKAGVSAPVDVEASNGSVRLLVGSDFSGEVVMSTSNGTITLPTGATVVEQSKDRAKIRLGAKGAAGVGGAGESRISTSNGSVTVQVR